MGLFKSRYPYYHNMASDDILVYYRTVFCYQGLLQNKYYSLPAWWLNGLRSATSNVRIPIEPTVGTSLVGPECKCDLASEARRKKYLIIQSVRLIHSVSHSVSDSTHFCLYTEYVQKKSSKT